MTSLPQHTPDSGDPEDSPGQVAIVFNERVMQLQQITKKLVTLSKEPVLPELSQVILQRDHLISSLHQLVTEHSLMPDALSKVNQSALEECQNNDKIIQKNLTGFQDKINKQLKEFKSSHVLLQKYKLVSDQPQETRNKKV